MNYDKAQQYVIGWKGVPGLYGKLWTWAVFGNGTHIPGEVEPGDADFEAAARKDGTTMTYEIGAKAFIWYGGRTDPVSSVGSEIRQLEPGIQIGFDVTADSRRGPEPHDDYEFGVVAGNLDTQKFIYADRFQRWELLDYDGVKVPPECGDWGYLARDVDLDCYVGLSDFAQWSVYWLDCTNPNPPCSYKP